MHDRKVRNRDLSAGLKERDAIDIEAELPREFIEQEAPYIDLTDDDGRYDEATTFYQYGDFPDPSPITNVTSGERELRKYTCDSGLELRKGWTVELRSSLGPRFFGAEFLKIAAIIKHQDRRVVLRGHVYTRAKNLAGILERKLNEIVLVAEVLRSTRTDWNRQAMIDIDPNEVKNVRVLRTTNAAHPEYGIEWEDYEAKGRRWVLTEGHLVCRWHYISVYKDEKTQKASKIEEWLVRRVTNAESDMSYAVKDETNINSWRGGNILGGSVTKTGRHQPSKVIDLEYVPLAPAQTLQELQDRKYSGGDIFCGAGGISRGMKDANIKIVFAVDSWDLATSTYKRNFPTVDIHPWDVHDFVTNVGVNRRVDILHLSPPCQYWSPAHTVPGQNDEPNVAALFSCGHVIEKVRPRVFTIEQTFGILFDRFKQYFATFVSGFTSQGYSVRWKIVHFAAWGLCQTRQRLIIIGAAPGEHLPDFPKDTHAPKANPKQGRKAYVSVKDVFQGVELRRDRNWHDLTTTEARALESRQKGSRKFTPWSWEQQAGTITCSGGQNNYHWSERRAYTVREYACLQGFPMNHFFNGSRAQSIKQIGNAVPPTIAKRLYDHIVQLLKIQDGAIPPAST
ncbi:S-adenosyl-L-methionine-dependent methyltransferase, partial [Coniochaeta sp. 2T2.1]